MLLHILLLASVFATSLDLNHGESPSHNKTSQHSPDQEGRRRSIITSPLRLFSVSSNSVDDCKKKCEDEFDAEEEEDQKTNCTFFCTLNDGDCPASLDDCKDKWSTTSDYAKTFPTQESWDKLCDTICSSSSNGWIIIVSVIIVVVIILIIVLCVVVCNVAANCARVTPADTPLADAVEAGDREKIEEILSKSGAKALEKEKNVPLFKAVKDLELIKLFESHGADMNAIDEYKSPLIRVAAREGQWDVVSYLFEKNVVVEDWVKRDMICFAAAQGQTEWIDTLHEKGAKIEADSDQSCLMSPMHMAAAAGNERGMAHLLELGVSLDVKAQANWYKGAAGVTPMMYVIETVSSPYNTVSWLVDHGADVNCRDSQGYTALGHALSFNQQKYPEKRNIANYLRTKGGVK